MVYAFYLDMKLRQCRYPTCHKLIPYDQPFCTDHMKYYHRPKVRSPYRKTNYIEYNHNRRDKKANQFYHSRGWKNLSAELRRQALWTCAACGRTKDGPSYLVVDHIIPLKVDPRRKLDRDNLWVLCKRCHFWKTKLEQKIYGDDLIANLDASKHWSRSKIRDWILNHERDE